MALESKAQQQKKQKDEEKRLREIKQDYINFSKTEGGRDYIQHLSQLAEDYFRSAMRETDRDKKSTLVDTSSGVMTALNRMTEMSKPLSEKRDSKRSKKDAKSPASQSEA